MSKSKCQSISKFPSIASDLHSSNLNLTTFKLSPFSHPLKHANCLVFESVKRGSQNTQLK